MNDKVLRGLGVRWMWESCVLCGEKGRVFKVKMWEKKVNEGEFEKILVCEGCFDEKRMFWLVNWELGGDKRDEEVFLKNWFKVESRIVKYCKVKVELFNKISLLRNGSIEVGERIFWEKRYDKVVRSRVLEYFEFVGEKKIEKLKNGKRVSYWKRVKIEDEWEVDYGELRDNWGSGSGGRFGVEGLSEDEESLYYDDGLRGVILDRSDDKKWSDYR